MKSFLKACQTVSISRQPSEAEAQQTRDISRWTGPDRVASVRAMKLIIMVSGLVCAAVLCLAACNTDKPPVTSAEQVDSTHRAGPATTAEAVTPQ